MAEEDGFEVVHSGELSVKFGGNEEDGGAGVGHERGIGANVCAHDI